MTAAEIREILLAYDKVAERFDLPEKNLAAFYAGAANSADSANSTNSANSVNSANSADSASLVNSTSSANSAGENLFAIIHENSTPLRIDLKVDANLAKLLKQKYESVANAPQLNPRNWVEILLTGQLADDEVRDLLRHSYEIAKTTT